MQANIESSVTENIVNGQHSNTVDAGIGPQNANNNKGGLWAIDWHVVQVIRWKRSLLQKQQVVYLCKSRFEQPYEKKVLKK